MEAYYVAKENGVWKSYMYNAETDKYAEFDPTQYEGITSAEQFKGALAQEASLSISFKSCYDKFTFDAEKNEYYCESIINLDLADEVYGDQNLAARKAHVKFEKGKISSISANYVMTDKDNTDAAALFEEVGDSYYFEITKINNTVPTKPSNIE